MKIPSPATLTLSAAGMLIPALAAVAARKIAGRGYHFVTRAEAPKNPADPGVGWREAILWTLLSGAIGGLARLAVRRWLVETPIPSE
jgi:hypothetical protein